MHGQKYVVAFFMPTKSQGLLAMEQPAVSSQCVSVLSPQPSATPKMVRCLGLATLRLWQRLKESEKRDPY